MSVETVVILGLIDVGFEALRQAMRAQAGQPIDTATIKAKMQQVDDATESAVAAIDASNKETPA